ncbi:MAG: hypothetical protein L3J35_10835 [Bacteroidales bacterium]|nr:hypothetical protein [Bacteroidales bacterium]
MNLHEKLIIVFLVIITFACDNKISTEDGKLITHSLCKNGKNLVYETNETCVEYSYNTESKTLNLKHINTAFNCCPGKLYCDISVKNDTIILEEIERKQDCNCLCLYDMEADVYNIEAKSYVIKYIEPYIGYYDELIFEIDLSVNISGNYCQERNNYPWGINN